MVDSLISNEVVVTRVNEVGKLVIAKELPSGVFAATSVIVRPISVPATAVDFARMRIFAMVPLPLIPGCPAFRVMPMLILPFAASTLGKKIASVPRNEPFSIDNTSNQDGFS